MTRKFVQFVSIEKAIHRYSRYWVSFRLADDTGVERLRSILRRFAGSTLASSYFPRGHVIVSPSRLRNGFAGRWR
jgi:hypothetical protein